jgi:hypothetical protein
MSSLASRRMSADRADDGTGRPSVVRGRTPEQNPVVIDVIPCHDPIATGVLPPATG